jgi:Glycosyltransferase
MEEVAGSWGFFFDPNSPESIAEACCDVLSLTDQQRCDRVKSAKEWVENNYSPERVLPSFLNLILESAAG